MDQDKVAQVLADSASTLVKVAKERDDLHAKNIKLAQENAALLRRMDAEKVAMDMHERGINADVPIETLVGTLEKKAETDPQNYAVLKEAVGLTGPDMFKAASVGGKTEASGGSSFERFILGAVSE